MGAYEVYRGGGLALGQATASVTSSDITSELASRGYAVHVPVVHHVPVVAQFTKSMAITVAIDEGISRLGISRTSSHPYRCPTSSCPIPASTWASLVSWCVTVANGYLTGLYSLPTWAQSAHHAGTLHGAGLSGMSHLGGFGDWLNENPWFLKSVGDTVTNYGEYLTAKNIEDAIKANTDKQLTKDDALALIAALQQGGYVSPGQAGTVAKGAMMAAQPSWVVPAMVVGGAALLILVIMKK